MRPPLGGRVRDRALAVGLFEFVAILVVAALLYILMDPGATDIITTASGRTTDAAAQNHINQLEQIWDLILIFAVFLSGLFILARSVFESRRP